MVSEKQKPILRAGLGTASRWPRHSLLRHPGVLEGDKDQVQTLQPNAVELSVELISQLLLQLTIILLCIYLGRDLALRAGEARVLGRPRRDIRPLSTQVVGLRPWFHSQLPSKPGKELRIPVGSQIPAQEQEKAMTLKLAPCS